MMKPIFNRLFSCISLLLCLALCGCQTQVVTPTEPITIPPTEAPTEPPVTEPPYCPAMDTLLTIYGEQDLSSTVDYSLINFIQLEDANYIVNWSVDVDASLVAVVDNQDGTATIDVNELCTEDTPYTLTAKIATADGRWVAHSWACTLFKALDPAEVLAEAHALPHGHRLSYPATLVGQITSITKDFDEDYSSITVIFRVPEAENQKVRCYGLSGDGVENLKIGDVIAVTGYLQNYGSVINFDSGCTLKTIS